jgi:hypothetical protein
MMIATCVALCLALSLGAAAPQNQEKAPAARALSVLSLQPFTAPGEAMPAPPFGTLMTTPTGEHALIYQREEPQFPGERVLELLRQLHQKESEDGSLDMRFAGGLLMLLAPAPLGKQIDAELHDLLAVVGRPIELDLAVYAWEGPLPGTVLGADEAAKTLAGRPTLAHGLATTRSSICAAFDQLRWSRYVRTAEAEVAQKASTSGPVVNAFAEGLAALVEPHALVDRDDVVLFAQFALGQRREVATLATGVADRPSLDFPRLDSAFGAVAACVPNGGALLVPLGGHPQAGARMLLALTVHAAPRPPMPGSVAALPIGALTSNALTQMPPIPGLSIDLHAAETARTGDGSGPPLIEPGELLDLLRASAGNREGTTVEAEGGFAFVRGDDGARQSAAALLRALQDRMLANVELRCTAELREVEGGGALAAATGAGTAVFHDLALPCLPGRTSVLFRGREQTLIADQQIEIAQEAFAFVPSVVTLTSGLWLRARPAVVEGGVRPDLRAQWSHDAPPQQRRVEPQGMVMLTDTGRARFAVEQLLPAGADVVLGDAPVLALDGRSWRPTLRVRAQAK